MSTAAEMMMFMQAIDPQIAKLQPVLKELYGRIIEDSMVQFMGREVSAKRMRLLDRRGAVIRFSRYTSTGKRRYKWLPAESASFGTICASSQKMFDADHNL